MQDHPRADASGVPPATDSGPRDHGALAAHRSLPPLRHLIEQAVTADVGEEAALRVVPAQVVLGERHALLRNTSRKRDGR